jgi:formate hydrogenlyase subunit 4
MYGALIANFFIGVLPYWISIPLFFSVQIGFAIVVGLIESFTARFRMGIIHNIFLS